MCYESLADYKKQNYVQLEFGSLLSGVIHRPRYLKWPCPF
jgi:hypothetical protein